MNRAAAGAHVAGTVIAMDRSEEYTAIIDAYGHAAAFAALAQNYPEHAGAIAAVESGASTTTLPAKVAAVAVTCLPLDAVEAATANDTRATIREAAEKRLIWKAVPQGDLSAMARQLAGVNAATVRYDLDRCDNIEILTGLLEHVATWGCRPASGERSTFSAAIIDVAHLLSRYDRIRLAPGAPSEARTRVVIAAAAAGVDLSPALSPDVTLDDLRAVAATVAEHADEFTPAGRGFAVGGQQLRERGDLEQFAAEITMAIWARGGTIADMCVAYRGTAPTVLPDGTVDAWLSVAHQNYDPNVYGPLDDVLRAVTDDGKLHRIVDHGVVELTSAAERDASGRTIALAVIAAFIDRSADGGDHTASFGDLICGAFPHVYPDTEIAAALEQNPTLATDTFSLMGAELRRQAPQVVIEGIVAAHGLGRWIDPQNSVDIGLKGRLRDAATAAGFTSAHWALTWRLATDFRGTPEQLVDMVTELTPTP